jgi:hypothetical protein
MYRKEECKVTALDLSRVVWRKSVRSGYENNCVEVGRAAWRKSVQSGQNGSCVEVADLPGAIAVRDSKNPDGAKLAFTRREWKAFAAGAKGGRFDL